MASRVSHRPGIDHLGLSRPSTARSRTTTPRVRPTPNTSSTRSLSATKIYLGRRHDGLRRRPGQGIQELRPPRSASTSRAPTRLRRPRPASRAPPVARRSTRPWPARSRARVPTRSSTPATTATSACSPSSCAVRATPVSSCPVTGSEDARYISGAGQAAAQGTLISCQCSDVAWRPEGRSFRHCLQGEVRRRSRRLLRGGVRRRQRDHQCDEGWRRQLATKRDRLGASRSWTTKG